MIKEFISHKVYLVKGGTKTEEFHIFSLAHILTNYIRNTLKNNNNNFRTKFNSCFIFTLMINSKVVFLQNQTHNIFVHEKGK